MAHSLEVRAPLLDYRVVEFACRSPLSFKLNGRVQKRILKDVAGDLIPQEIVNRPKYGFQIPLGEWFKGRLKQWAEPRLLEPEHNLFNNKAVNRLWDDHLQGRADNAHKIWLLLVLNQWSITFGHDQQ
jgi:asparagine synthase (glutamine-hydrolysing)